MASTSSNPAEPLPEKERKTKHLVVSRFNEQLEWMQGLPLEHFDRVFIYNKGKDDLNLDGCTSRCKETHQVIKLPNVGKCDHTYLHHIIAHYYDLPDVTVFLPGCCDDEVKWFNAIVTVTVALTRGDSMFVCHEYKEGVRAHFFPLYMDTYASRDKRNRNDDHEQEAQKTLAQQLQPSPVRPYGIWYAMHFPNTEVHHVAYFGIFAASKQHIHNRDFDGYVSLYKYVNTHANPEVGHYMERSWLAVFHPVVTQSHVYVCPENKFFKLPVPKFAAPLAETADGAAADGTAKLTEPYTLDTLRAMLGLRT